MGAPVLDCTSLCILGKKLILSGALMEAGLASFVQAESEKIEAIVENYQDNDNADLPNTADVIQLNRDVKDAFEAIRLIEELILAKINIGNGFLYVQQDPCPCDEDNNIDCTDC